MKEYIIIKDYTQKGGIGVTGILFSKRKGDIVKGVISNEYGNNELKFLLRNCSESEIKYPPIGGNPCYGYIPKEYYKEHKRKDNDFNLLISISAIVFFVSVISLIVLRYKK